LTHKLEKLEQTERFLKKEVNLIWLANYLQTNSKYTTEVIKIHAKKKFQPLHQWPAHSVHIKKAQRRSAVSRI